MSHAELHDVEAGKYIIEQKIIPDKFIKDTRQIINITRDEYGYALFIIDKEQVEEFEKTKVTINKEIVNENGDKATEQDFEEAKIDPKEKYSFEVKIKNIKTKEIYYTFIDDKNADTIIGLPYGTYEIEEIYKPKFKMLEITGERLVKDEETGKYIFTLSEDNEEIQNNIIINIKNKIDKEFGFGGQDSKDNLSKLTTEDIEDLVVTKAKIYVRDDKNNKNSDATFKLYDSNGNIVKLAGDNGIYFESQEGTEIIKPINGEITLRGLLEGEYKLVNESVSESFLKSRDRDIIVYEKAVGITRIELLRNIPRGGIRLSTVYTNDFGEEHFTPRSKYKILNTSTNELLTFIKKADGTYERSNLPNAKEIISLKAGYTDVKGVEAGIEYQVGLVDVTESYGIIKEEPEVVTLEEGENKEVKVSVQERKGFVKVITPGVDRLIVALDGTGKIWMDYAYNSSKYALEENYQLKCISNGINPYEAIKNIRFKDIDVCDNSDTQGFVAVDTDGKVWTWGLKNRYGTLGDGSTSGRLAPVCISDMEGNPLCENNVRIKKVTFNGAYGNAVFALDEQGKIWFWGKFDYQNTSEPIWLSQSNLPKCISDMRYQQLIYDDQGNAKGIETVDCELKDVVITDISCGYGSIYAIDNNGKLWTFGSNYNGGCGLPYNDEKKGSLFYIKPMCVNDFEDSNIKNVKIKKAAGGYGVGLFIDIENRLWVCGDGFKLGIGNNTENHWNPICLNENNEGNPLNGIGIIDVACQNETISAIDENGKLWTWGSDSGDGMLGLGDYCYDLYGSSYISSPICITDLENNKLETTKLISTSAPYVNNAAAIDCDGNLWIWGCDERIPVGMGMRSGPIPPTKIMLAQPAHFEIPNFRKIEAGYNTSAGIDENGHVWTWGHGGYLGTNLGTGCYDYNKYSNYASVNPIMVGGSNNTISKENIIDVSVGYQHTIALDDKGRLWFWGSNSNQQIGQLNEINKYDTYGSPICITDIEDENNPIYGKRIVKIEAKGYINAIIDSEGKLYINRTSYTGRDDNGNYYNGFKFSDDITDSSYRYECINNLYDDLKNKKIVDVSISNSTSCNHLIVLDEDGKVWTWSSKGSWSWNDYGELGYISEEKTNNLVCISNMKDNLLYGKKITSISAGSYHSGAIDEDGKLYLWGSHSDGQLGDGIEDIFNQNKNLPICITDNENSKLYGKRIEKIELGNSMTLVIDSEGKVYTCGSNNYNQLGRGLISGSHYPNEMVCINENTDFIPTDISVGSGNNVLALDAKGNIWAWGYNEYNKSGLSSAFPLKWVGETHIYSFDGENLETINKIQGMGPRLFTIIKDAEYIK